MVSVLAKRSGRSTPIKRWHRNVIALLSLAFYGVMGPLGYLAFLSLALIPARDRATRALWLQGIMRRAFAMLHHWMRWFDFEDYDPRSLRGKVYEGSCVVISNHPALNDVTNLMSAVPRLCTAVNRTTFNHWWLRPLLEQAGQFCGGAQNPLGSGTVLDTAAERLRQGFRVLVFPEGHRSPRGQLRPFARGAFEIACRNNVPVVPILIRADPLWLARGDRLFPVPHEVPKKRLEVLDTLDPADFGGDSRAMRDFAEAMYSRLLDAPIARRSLAAQAPRPLGEAIESQPGGLTK